MTESSSSSQAAVYADVAESVVDTENPSNSPVGGSKRTPRKNRAATKAATPDAGQEAHSAGAGQDDATVPAARKPARTRTPASGTAAPKRTRKAAAAANEGASAPAPEVPAGDADPASPAEAAAPKRTRKAAAKSTRGRKAAAAAAPDAIAPGAVVADAATPDVAVSDAGVADAAVEQDAGGTPVAGRAAPARSRSRSRARAASPEGEVQAAEAPAGKPAASEPSGGLSLPDESADAGIAHATHVSDAPDGAEAAAPVAVEGDDTPVREGRRQRRGRRGGRGRKKAASASEAAEFDHEGIHEPDEAAASDASTITSPADKPQKAGKRRMFISVVPSEQVEVVLEEGGSVHEYYLEMLHQAKTKGNIYKGVIHNIDTNLQAAFVNYGTGKNGFLQIDEIHPEYYLVHHDPVKGKKYPPIQKVMRAGQEVLVQVVKEPTGNKGAFLTTWVSLAGRFLVLTPGQEQIGVSRKVDSDEERARLKELMNGIDPGEGLGVIVRTVSAGMAKTTLKNDLQYLKRVWKDIRKRATTEAAPCQLYKESELAQRAIRDYLTDDVAEIWVDEPAMAESLRETVGLLFPRKGDLVRVHESERQTLWERFNIQRQLEQIYSREVHLPSGGRLVFDQTEALMAIDINSGKISGKVNFESMAYKTNMEAAEAIARHLRLRDIGGQIVIDFIEMRDKKHVRDVERVLRNAMKNDRARHDVAHMSSFGLLEIVRQRTGSSALAITMEPCPACGGTGMRRNLEWRSLQALREIQHRARHCGNGKCVYEATAELGMYLLNHKRERLQTLEHQHNVAIEIHVRP